MRELQTPILILPDDIPAHPYEVAMEAAMLAPRSEVSMFPWKRPRERIHWRCARRVARRAVQEPDPWQARGLHPRRGGRVDAVTPAQTVPLVSLRPLS